MEFGGKFKENIQYQFVLILHPMFIYLFIYSFIVEDMFYSHVYILDLHMLGEGRN